MTKLSEQDRNEIKSAFWDGNLKVRAVNPLTKESSYEIVSDVMQHDTPQKDIVKVTTISGRSVKCTVDHSLFKETLDGGISSFEAGTLAVGDRIVVVDEDDVYSEEVTSVIFLQPEQHTYDLCVPNFENFTLTNGILAHNSYSIGGISLDIDKSSKYESIKNNAESQLDKLLEAKRNTVKIMRGLQQSRYGIGLRSALGPHVGSGVLHPRHYIGF